MTIYSHSLTVDALPLEPTHLFQTEQISDNIEDEIRFHAHSQQAMMLFKNQVFSLQCSLIWLIGRMLAVLYENVPGCFIFLPANRCLGSQVCTTTSTSAESQVSPLWPVPSAHSIKKWLDTFLSVAKRVGYKYLLNSPQPALIDSKGKVPQRYDFLLVQYICGWEEMTLVEVRAQHNPLLRY